MKTWYDIYVERMNDVYRKHVAEKYGKMVDTIIGFLPKQGGTMAEYGCGAANISRLVVEKKQTVFTHLVDIDNRMLGLADHNMREAGMRSKEDFVATLANILEPVVPYFHKGYDIIHSHGVLEHFSDEQIRDIVRNQLKNAPVVVHYVPSEKYEMPSFGDERLMSVAQWQQICEPTDIIQFNDGFDLLMIWDNTINYLRKQSRDRCFQVGVV